MKSQFPQIYTPLNWKPLRERDRFLRRCNIDRSIGAIWLLHKDGYHLSSAVASRRGKRGAPNTTQTLWQRDVKFSFMFIRQYSVYFKNFEHSHTVTFSVSADLNTLRGQCSDSSTELRTVCRHCWNVWRNKHSDVGDRLMKRIGCDVTGFDVFQKPMPLLSLNQLQESAVSGLDWSSLLQFLIVLIIDWNFSRVATGQQLSC